MWCNHHHQKVEAYHVPKPHRHISLYWNVCVIFTHIIMIISCYFFKYYLAQKMDSKVLIKARNIESNQEIYG